MNTPLPAENAPASSPIPTSTPARTSQTSSLVASNRQLSPSRLGYSAASTTQEVSTFIACENA